MTTTPHPHPPGGLSIQRKFGLRCTAEALGSLSRDVFERRTSTGSGVFALFGCDFEQILGQIVSIRVKTLGHTNSAASRHIKREEGSLLVDVRRWKTSLLKLPIPDPVLTHKLFILWPSESANIGLDLFLEKMLLTELYDCSLPAVH